MKHCKFLQNMCLCLLLVAVLCTLPVSVQAEGKIDLSAPVSLTVHALCGTVPMDGMQMDAYLVATADETGALSLTEPFAELLSEEDMQALSAEQAEQLAQQVTDHPGVYPKTSVLTGSDGTAAFETLTQGLYLICGDIHPQGNQVYCASAFFVMLPQRNDGQWEYDVTAYAKMGESEEYIILSVSKAWADSCHITRRPSNIRFQLYCDGEPYGQPVTLPYQGHWSYTWPELLEAAHNWTVEEEPVAGYTPTVTRKSGWNFLITNTCNHSDAEGDTPSLPQTGQLWWPVPLLTLAGLLLVVIGLLIRRGERRGK